MIKKKEGFTLVEVIFSIAFLSIISVIILKLLIASYDVENRTDLMDMATLYMSNEIENIKNLESVDSDVDIVKYYGENWQRLDSKSEAVYVVTVNMTLNAIYDRGLYDIYASVVDLEKNDELMHINTMHYYNNKE